MPCWERSVFALAITIYDNVIETSERIRVYDEEDRYLEGFTPRGPDRGLRFSDERDVTLKGFSGTHAIARVEWS